MNKPNKIFVHCSATDDANTSIGASDIDEWHRARGWDSIGYHYVIPKSGILQKGRLDDRIGAHAKGFNTDSLGICLVGTYDFNDKQISTLVDLLYKLMKRWGIHTTDLKGHYEVNSNKTCPNIPGAVLRRLMQAEIANRKAYPLARGLDVSESDPSSIA